MRMMHKYIKEKNQHKYVSMYKLCTICIINEKWVWIMFYTHWQGSDPEIDCKPKYPQYGSTRCFAFLSHHTHQKQQYCVADTAYYLLCAVHTIKWERERERDCVSFYCPKRMLLLLHFVNFKVRNINRRPLIRHTCYRATEAYSLWNTANF